ncbi:MAG: beta-ketoacyl-ACP synthase II [Symbiobacteriaceae bacterium]|nr:beta-ketoacyl-ACP synthase II [Symbiobacteriaceae bacterium]
MKKRVVITGIGAVTPLGLNATAFWDGVKAGKNGIGPLTRLNPEGYSCLVAAQVEDFDPTVAIDRREVRRLDRYCQMAIVAADEALKQADLGRAKVEAGSVDATRFGVIVSSGIGGIATLESEHTKLLERGPGRVSALCVPMMLENMSAGNLSIFSGARGPCSSVVTACATGTNSIGDAYKLIQRGDADLMLAGGSEAAITPLAFAGFCAMKAMTGRNDEPHLASRPFDARRDGFVMGEGAGVLLLEELEHALLRGVEILAEVVGYGWSSDSYHITAPSPDGEGLSRGIDMALADAAIKPEDIAYINAHGTSTQLNDKVETAAIKRSFGAHAYRVGVSSTKSMIGHLLGAAGAVEAIVTLKSCQEDYMPPTINYTVPDSDCDLDYIPNTGRRARVEYAISNNSGFGGHNACLIFKKWRGA